MKHTVQSCPHTLFTHDQLKKGRSAFMSWSAGRGRLTESADQANSAEQTDDPIIS